MSASRRRITIVFGLVVTVGLLWWALRDVSIPEMLGHLRRANFWWLGAAAIATLGTMVLRALRWRLLLEPALEESSFDSRFSAVCIGFMANNLLPARLGEFARVYAFARREAASMSATFASLVVERLLDGVILVLFLVAAVWLADFPDDGGAGTLRHVSAAAAGVVAVGFLVLGLLVRVPERLLRLASGATHRILPQSAADRITGVLASFVAGLGALRHAHLFARVFAWTAVVWLWNGLTFWLGFLAFDIRGPGLAGALLLQSIIGFAVSVPSSPGFFGPFEAGARLALTSFGVIPALILSFAVGYHITSFIPVTVLGLWYARRLGISLSEVERSEEIVEAEVERAGEEVERRVEAMEGPAG